MIPPPTQPTPDTLTLAVTMKSGASVILENVGLSKLTTAGKPPEWLITRKGAAIAFAEAISDTQQDPYGEIRGLGARIEAIFILKSE